MGKDLCGLYKLKSTAGDLCVSDLSHTMFS